MLSLSKLDKDLRILSKMLILLSGTWSILKCLSLCRRRTAGPKKEITHLSISKLISKIMIWETLASLMWSIATLLGNNTKTKPRNLECINKIPNTTNVCLVLWSHGCWIIEENQCQGYWRLPLLSFSLGWDWPPRRCQVTHERMGFQEMWRHNLGKNKPKQKKIPRPSLKFNPSPSKITLPDGLQRRLKKSIWQ